MTLEDRIFDLISDIIYDFSIEYYDDDAANVYEDFFNNNEDSIRLQIDKLLEDHFENFSSNNYYT